MKKLLAGAALCMMFATPAYATCSSASNEAKTVQKGYVNGSITAQDGGCITYFNYNKSKTIQITPTAGAGSNYSKTVQKDAFFNDQFTKQLGGENESEVKQEGVVNWSVTVQGP